MSVTFREPDLFVADVIEHEMFTFPTTIDYLGGGVLQFTVPGHPFVTGYTVQVAAGVLPDTIIADTDYWVIVLDADTIQLAATLADAQAGTAIEYNIQGSASGVLTWTQRVVVYDENWEAPKDLGLYVVIMTGETEIIGSTAVYDPDTDTEETGIAAAQRLLVNVTSKDRSALSRKEEVIMALTSTFSQQQQEAQQMRLTREGAIQDLSFIEGAAALHRYQVPVKIFFVKVKTKAIPVIDGFPFPEIVEEA
jgi:hypothetical protein